METDPINPASPDSTPSMEIKSTDPIESGTQDPKPSAAEPPASEPLDSVAPSKNTSLIGRGPVEDSVATPTEVATPSESEAIAERIEVSATATEDKDDTSSSGGEWDLLTAKVRQWWQENNLVELWKRSRRPIYLIIGLIVLTLLIRIYSGILAAIDSIPLVPRMFELVGLGWLIWFSATKLIRSEERKTLLKNISGIWGAFRGSDLS